MSSSTECVLANNCRGRKGSTPARSLLADQRGAAFVEYAAVTAVIGVMMVVALSALGVPLFALYLHTERLLALPVP